MTAFRLSDPAGGAVGAADGVRIPSADVLQSERPQRTLALLGEESSAKAVASLWWLDTPSFQGRRTGLIGHLSRVDSRAGAALLQAGCAILREQGCEVAVAPINGSTWRNYRVAIWSSGRPPFALEPETPESMADDLARADFTVAATYVSSVIHNPAQPNSRLEEFGAGLANRGIEIRPFDPAATERDLALVHEMSVQSFSRNLLYSPMPLSDYLRMYRPVLPMVQPDYFLLAMHEGRCVAFLFGLPDFEQARRGETVDTLIMKTVANRPGKAWMGLGLYLAYRLGRQAAADGFKTVIHALMREGNRSVVPTLRHGDVIRRYALFAKPLLP